MLLRISRYAAIVGSAGVGVYFVYSRRLQENAKVTAAAHNEKQQEAVEVFKRHPDLLRAAPLLLYRYATCPFCSKVQVFLRFHGLSYRVREVDPMMKSQLKGLEYRKVPQLQLGTEGPVIVDSRAIPDILTEVLHEEAAEKMGERTPRAEEWRDWAASDLVRLLVVNNNRTLSEASAGYKYVDGAPLPWASKMFLKAAGGPTMYLVANFVTRKRLHRSGYTPEMLDGHEREVLGEQLQRWVDEGLQGRPFEGGEKPSQADLDTYGIVVSCRGLPVWEHIEQSAAAPWIARMNELVPDAAGFEK